MSSEKMPTAIDLSHHLSDVGKARASSPLKTMQRYWGKPGLISLAGGMPSPAYFPFESLSGDALLPDSFPLTLPPKSSALSWFWNLFSTNTTPISVPKYPAKPDAVNLAAALQYQMATGIPALQEIIHEFTSKVYKPGYQDFHTLAHIGNTDGFYRTIVTFCNPGEGVLVAEWTYPSALAAMRPPGVIPVAVSMDAQGISSDSLRKTLLEWDNIARGMPRPHVLYTVPVGQNPTGATMGAIRKKEIYDICVEFDVIIIEDDPYFFLQEGPYVPKLQRLSQDAFPTGEEEYLSNLVPSFLKFDYQGRVIRLDTFSKTIAPGSRLGWFTCNPLFAERLERHGEISTQAPCGFGQSMVVKLLLTWKYEGYIRWLRAIRVQYTLRRNQFLDCLGEEFHLQHASAVGGNWEGSDLYLAFLKSNDTQIVDTGSGRASYNDKPIFSFVPPTSGMFVWIKLHLEGYPSVPSEEEESLEMQLWSMLADAGMLIVPGFMFKTEQSSDKLEGHFRISFSDAEPGDMKQAIIIFERVLRQFFTKS